MDEPKNFDDAMKSDNHLKWKEAMNQEYNSLIENNTWELVPLPEGRSPVGSKWIFKIKTNDNDEPERFKARLVAKGYS